MLRVLLSILSFLCVTTVLAQDYEAQQRKLEARKIAIQKEINQVKNLMNQEKKKERNILSEIENQNKKIKLTTDLIKNTQKEQNNIKNLMYINTLELDKLKRELKVLKEDYAKTIQKSYKIRSEQSRILFILSSDNFLQAYKRFQYMKQYAKFRKEQGDEIRAKTEKLDEVTKKMEVQKKKQDNIIIEQEANKKTLEEEKQKQNQLMSEVRKDIKKYSTDIKKKQDETKKIDREIKAIIKKAIEEANRKAREAKEKAERERREKAERERREKVEKERREKEEREKRAREAKANTTSTTSSKKEETKSVVIKKETPKTHVSSERFENLTAEEKTLANNFRANRGKLPWPVEKGNISLRYGNHPHPTVPDVTIYNSGIEISTQPGASVRAVFDGEVLMIQSISGAGKAVFIRHGEFITIYQNLNSVSVSTGQKVKTKQTIGTVKTNGEGKTILKFLITENSTTNNPESWLNR